MIKRTALAVVLALTVSAPALAAGTGERRALTHGSIQSHWHRHVHALERAPWSKDAQALRSA